MISSSLAIRIWQLLLMILSIPSLFKSRGGWHLFWGKWEQGRSTMPAWHFLPGKALEEVTRSLLDSLLLKPSEESNLNDQGLQRVCFLPNTTFKPHKHGFIFISNFDLLLKTFWDFSLLSKNRKTLKENQKERFFCKPLSGHSERFLWFLSYKAQTEPCGLWLALLHKQHFKVWYRYLDAGRGCDF